MKKSELIKIVKESVSFSKGVKKMKSRIKTHKHLLELFGNSLREEIVTNDASKDVLSKIQNNNFDNNPKNFYNGLNKSTRKEMLTDYSVEELSQMKLFKVSGYNIGYALKKYEDGTFSEIVAVFNNEPNIKGVGKELMKSAIRNGGKHLDHFSGYLSDFYQSLGFDEHKRDKFDPQYDEDGSFRKKYGEADVIYRTHNGQ